MIDPERCGARNSTQVRIVGAPRVTHHHVCSLPAGHKGEHQDGPNRWYGPTLDRSRPIRGEERGTVGMAVAAAAVGAGLLALTGWLLTVGGWALVPAVGTAFVATACVYGVGAELGWWGEEETQ